MACVSAQRWLPDEDMKGDARKIISGLDEATFRFIMPIDDEHPLPPEWKIESQLLDSDSLTAWLCAYWEGRYRAIGKTNSHYPFNKNRRDLPYAYYKIR